MGPMFDYMTGGTGQTMPPLTDPTVPQVPNMGQNLMPVDNGIDVVGWRPHKESFLGRLGDALLMMNGNKPLFREKNNERNLQEAMQGFTSDPLATIQKISRIKGMEGKALDLYNQYVDNQRADAQAQALQEYRKGMFRDRVASMLGAVNEQNASRLLPLIKQSAERMGLDPTEVPDTYDPDQIGMYRMGGMKVDQQIDNARDAAYKSARLGQIDETIQSRERYQNARLGQMGATLSERERHNRAMENRPPASARKPSVSYVNTKYGPGEVSPDGKLMKIDREGGSVIYYNVGPNQWKLVKKVPKTDE